MATSKSYLTDSDMQRMEEAGEILSFKKGEVVVQQRTKIDSIYWIRSGVIQVDFNRLYGADTLAYLGEGDLFGEVSFLDSAETSASVVAADKLEILAVSRDVLAKLMEEDAAFAARFYHTLAATLARRIRSQNRK